MSKHRSRFSRQSNNRHLAQPTYSKEQHLNQVNLSCWGGTNDKAGNWGRSSAESRGRCPYISFKADRQDPSCAERQVQLFNHLQQRSDRPFRGGSAALTHLCHLTVPLRDQRRTSPTPPWLLLLNASTDRGGGSAPCNTLSKYMQRLQRRPRPPGHRAQMRRKQTEATPRRKRKHRCKITRDLMLVCVWLFLAHG